MSSIIADMSTAQSQASASQQAQHGGQETSQASDHHISVQAEHKVLSEPSFRDLDAQER